MIPSISYAGFDWGGGSGSCSGSGDFKQQILDSAIVTVGEIPSGKNGVFIKLRSNKDVDIQLYDKFTGDKIVHWPDGLLRGAGKETTNYKGVSIEWSGYNGDGTGKGHEYIKITGTTNRTLVMKAYGYQAGYASIDYSWSGTQGCSEGDVSENGTGEFQQQILNKAIVTVGEIPKGISSLYIRLSSNKDVDIQLYDKNNGTKIIVWPDGLLKGAGEQSTNYKGMSIQWSGYNGDGTGSGNEYIYIKGKTTRNLVMKAYGYQSGFASVNYYWGKEKSDIFFVEKENSNSLKKEYKSASDNQLKKLLNKLVTSNDAQSTLKIISNLNKLNKLNELKTGLAEYDDSRHQALYLLEFMVRNSNNILGGGALKKGSLVETAILLENHANQIALYTGEAGTYIFVEEDGFFWDSNIELNDITLYPITQYNVSNQSFDHVANNGKSYEKKSYSWAFGHGFYKLPFGLYLAEFKRGGYICKKPVLVEAKAESTTKWLLAKGKCDVAD